MHMRQCTVNPIKNKEFLFMTKRYNNKGRLDYTFGQIYRSLSATDAADMAYVHIKTAQRWINGTQQPHPAVAELLKLKATGRILPDNYTEVFSNGRALVVPGGREIQQSAWLTIDHLQAAVDNLHQQNEQLKKRVSILAGSINF